LTKFTVRKGRRYLAEVTLGFIERLAGNDRVAAEIGKVGFTEVEVKGQGRRREAKALWPLEDRTGDIPPRITKIVELPSDKETDVA
jgi:hypothetical protein